MTALAGNLPKGQANGLDSIARSLIDEPHRVHAIIALIDCKKITTDNDSGEVVPTARIRRVEVVTAGDAATAERLIRRALERRTGQQVLPIDVEDELEQVFRDLRFDPATGEVLDDPAPAQEEGTDQEE